MGGGVYIASTQNLTITHNLPNSMGPSSETRSDRFSSKCEREAFRWDRHDQLDGTDVLGLGQSLISVRPILAMSKHGVDIAISVGPIAHFG